MESENKTSVQDFIIMGLTRDPYLQVPLFVFFLLVYIITVVDNIGIICLYHIDSHLHTPMYFFISNLSFVDLCCSSTITPKMLMGFLVDQNMISISECAAQLFFFFLFAVAESFIIALMKLDRYVAICKPLHYTTIMTERLCYQLSALPYAGGMMCAIIYTNITFRLPFCGHNKIAHYFCDIPPLFKLSCTDTSLSAAILFTVVSTICSIVITLIGMSYCCIFVAILRMHSSAGRSRVFSTCSSHLICVVLFYGTGLNMYLRPDTMDSNEKDKVMSVFYTVIISMLNPLIYSLRNKDVKAAFYRILKVLNNNRIFCKLSVEVM